MAVLAQAGVRAGAGLQCAPGGKGAVSHFAPRGSSAPRWEPGGAGGCSPCAPGAFCQLPWGVSSPSSRHPVTSTVVRSTVMVFRGVLGAHESTLTSYLANLNTENGLVPPLLSVQRRQRCGRGVGGVSRRAGGQAGAASAPGQEQVQLCGLRVSLVSDSAPRFWEGESSEWVVQGPCWPDLQF